MASKGNNNSCFSGIRRNPNLQLFESEAFYITLKAEISAFAVAHPRVKLLNLGVGDASEPIPEVITSAMAEYARSLSTAEGFSGYGSHRGIEPLRNKIVECFYGGLGVKASEIFVSDGAKGCIVRLLMLFGSAATLAVPDPSYPIIAQLAYIFADSSEDRPDKVVYLRTDPDKNFFPDLASAPRTDLIYFCSPNNPTGTAATREQLKELVAFAKKNGSIILYDAVYAAFVSDADCPKSIYEIPGADQVAIEIGSFSKVAGFTGVRLGWVVIPEAMVYADGINHHHESVIKDYDRVAALTNGAGASNIAQAGGLACLSEQGMKETAKLVEYYKENARILLEALESMGWKAHGGKNSPYIWVEEAPRAAEDFEEEEEDKSMEDILLRNGQQHQDSSMFREWLEVAHVVTTPGIHFGPSGESFLRISAFGHRSDILQVVQRLKLLTSRR